ncbi:MAG: hypothetical protein ACPGVD_08335 [Flavobacteriales bacterium]
MNKPIIVSELGKIWGRDAIFLDSIEFIETHTVKLKGEFNGALCEKIKENKFIPYEISFKELLEFRMVELDFFRDGKYTSSFEEIINSTRIKEFSENLEQTKLKANHKHFLFHTYDDIIQIIASSFELKLQ